MKPPQDVNKVDPKRWRDACERANMHPLTLIRGMVLLGAVVGGAGLVILVGLNWFYVVFSAVAWLTGFVYHRLALHRRRRRTYAKLQEEYALADAKRIFG